MCLTDEELDDIIEQGRDEGHPDLGIWEELKLARAVIAKLRKAYQSMSTPWDSDIVPAMTALKAYETEFHPLQSEPKGGK